MLSLILPSVGGRKWFRTQQANDGDWYKLSFHNRGHGGIFVGGYGCIQHHEMAPLKGT